MPKQQSILSVRVSEEERVLLEEAASQAHTTLSDFIRRRAIEAAETEVLSRSVVTIPASDWEAFEAWLERPPEARRPLQELARRKPSWER
jgi:uncharacterized protein (DUF1778 family)